jgi:hypothetical protein
MESTIRRLVAVASVVGAAAATAFTSGAVTSSATAASCPPPPTPVYPFTPWSDNASYVLTTGASFEQGSGGWSLSGGAQIVSGNAPNKLDPSSDSHSLSLPPGSSALSPCTTAPHIVGIVRFFLKNTGTATGALNVQVLVKGNTYDAGTISAGSSWQPSAMLPSNAPNYSGAVAYQVRLTPVGSGAAFTVDDVYFDPYASK